MRKWMRERVKRRKKPEDKPGTETSKPVPLQPDYYDANPPCSESHVDAAAAAPVEEAAPEVESVASEDATEVNGNLADGAAADPARKRRRRGRGGRGRGSSRSASATAAKAAAATRTEEPPVITAETAEEAPEPVLEAPPAPVAAPPHRASKGVVVLAIGLPGSGKSSWFKRHQIQPLSSDLLRALLFDDAQEQRFQDLVFSNLRSMLKARLIARRPSNYVDATNLTPPERHNWIKLAKDYGYEVQAVFFDVPLEVCLDRNRRRHRSVDEVIMQRMSAKLRPPTFDEGFSKITVVRVKRKDGDPVATAS
jgi:predicted kinase